MTAPQANIATMRCADCGAKMMVMFGVRESQPASARCRPCERGRR